MSEALFLSAEWRNLVILSFAVDPELLESSVPRGTELDLWNGKALVSLVGFQFLNTRVAGWRIPFHTNFDEVNLRFYVVRRIGASLRRGVVFIKEIVPRFAIAQVARLLYQENYVSRRMVHGVTDAEVGTRRLEYAWWEGASRQALAATIVGEPQELRPGSTEEFITEHYWGYTKQADGGTLEYRVEHPRWKLWRAVSSELSLDAARVYGQRFESVLSQPSYNCLVAQGSEIKVFRGIRLP